MVAGRWVLGALQIMQMEGEQKDKWHAPFRRGTGGVRGVKAVQTQLRSRLPPFGCSQHLGARWSEKG